MSVTVGNMSWGPNRELVFSAQLGAGTRGIWFWNRGGLSLVVQDGTAAPATGGGTFLIATILSLHAGVGVGVNGQLVFNAWVSGGNGLVTNGIWKLDAGGTMVTVVVDGAPSPTGLGTMSVFDNGQENGRSTNGIDTIGAFLQVGALSLNGIFAVQY